MPPSSLSFQAFGLIARLPIRAARPRPVAARLATFPRPITRFQQPLSKRFNSSQPTLTDRPNHKPVDSKSHKPHAPGPRQRPPQPEYEMTFTCTPCSTRSTHRVSKQGYHHGSVLITCPECRNRHVISDHLNMYGDRNVSIEDFMREQGQLVKKGTLSEDGDIEFWSDGTTTKRNKEGITETVERNTPKSLE